VDDRLFERTLIPLQAPVEDDPTPLRFAAVLALLMPDQRSNASDRLLFIERANDLRTHGGQLAFPGGKLEPEDPDLLSTALREASEEIGLDPQQVRVFGRLEPVPTPTGYLVVPFVGRADGEFVPKPVGHEVAKILTPSLDELCRPEIHRVTGSRSWRGRTFDLHEFAIHTPPLWGATARMVWDLLQRLALT